MAMPDVEVRPLRIDELPAAWEMGQLAFGAPRRPVPADLGRRRATRWGAFHRGRLVAKATDLHHEQYWDGEVVPAADVAGVAVLPEYRRQGLTRQVLRSLLEAARLRGAAVSTLFCTSAAVYRALGWEVGGFLREVELPTAALTPLPPSQGIRVRPGDGRDLARAHAAYQLAARSCNGWLTRAGEPRTTENADGALPEGIDGLSLAESHDGQLAGYLSWSRAEGYGAGATLTVHDLIALSAPAAAALLGVLASWGTVAPALRLPIPPLGDAAASLLPLERCRVVRTDVWMLRPVDAVGAVAARRWPFAVGGELRLRLADPLCPANDSGFRLLVEGGHGALERLEGEPNLRLDVRGWSQLWCGCAGAAQLRRSGLLSGGDPEQDWVLDLLLGGRSSGTLLDYF